MTTDVILINPRVTALDNYEYFSTLQSSLDMPPLGLMYIGTVLNEKSYSIKIYDLNAINNSEQRKHVIQEIINQSPRIIGISTMTPSYYDAVEIAKEIRKSHITNCRIIMGGYHVSYLYEDVLLNKYADVVVRGEGETIFADLAAYYLDNTDNIKLEDIPGISYVKDDEIVNNAPQFFFMKDLDELHYPDRKLIDLHHYNVPGTIMGSRGCIGKCQFCVAARWGTFRERSMENFYNELLYLKRNFDFKHICFIDNTFSVHKQRTLSLLKKITESNLKYSYSLETRVVNIDEEILSACKRANVVSIQFGVESGDERVLREINKGISLKEVENVIDKSLESGLNVMCTFIIGHPSDTVESISNTVAFVKKIRRKGVQTKFEVLTPYPGTEIYINRDKYGVKITNWDFTKWGSIEPVYETANLSVNKLRKLFRNAVMEVNTI